tara:strand:+ start:106 stop:381 length:276 start_codon:yes stop_codon:yes gene_type:complete
MIEKLNKLDLNLMKLEKLDKDSFSFNNFKELNLQLENVINEITLSINTDLEKKLSVDEQVFLEKILNKIEKLESKILPKANLLNSFSKSII